MDKETTDTIRNHTGRKNIKNINDDGETMTASVEVAEGIWRDNVEVVMPYGYSAHIPEDGAMGVVISLGGDEGDMAILPVANPSTRMGGLKENEVGLYNKDGDKLVLTPGGAMNVKTGAEVNITTDTGVTITAKVTKVVGDLECTGDVSDKNGSMQEMRDKYNEHGHPDASPPPSPLQD